MPERPLRDQFNLDTMSGIYPGERPAVYQRVLAVRVDRPDAPAHWFRLSWDQQPPGPLFHPDEPQAGDVDRLPTFRLAVTDARQTCILLASELAQRKWALHTCGTCAFWHRQQDATAGGDAAGQCGYRPAEPQGAATNATAARAKNKDDAFPAASADSVHSGVNPFLPLYYAASDLTAQSALSMACRHWAAAPSAHSAFAAQDHPNSEAAPVQPAISEPQAAPSLWRRLQTLLLPGRRAKVDRPSAKSIRSKKATAVGTEPCFACQGRIARLGSLTLAEPSKDNETFTVWRCHTCYTTYLGDWIDRWVRLDSLETEETLYRVAPADAAGLLEAFQISQTNADMRSGDSRRVLETRLRSMTQELEPLSHQVKLGR